MRCTDVLHELSALAGQPRPVSLTDHLAGCSSCARWAERNARLDQVWEATRPRELSAAAWDRMWANISESVDRTQGATAPPPVLAPVLAFPRPWHRSAAAVLVLAQAAAILAGFGLAWNQVPSRLRAPSVAIVAAPAPVPVPAMVRESSVEIAAFEISISSDQLALISLDQKQVRSLPTDEGSNGVSLFSLPMFNAMESLASLQ